jgi:transposase, IS30 family
MKIEKQIVIRKFTHLSKEERFTIQKMFAIDSKIRTIAEVLGRSPNTISRELKKNRVRGVYDWEKASHKAYLRRYNCKRDCGKVVMDRFLNNHVRQKLLELWSPRIISGELQREYGVTVSAKAIYKYAHLRSLERCLFWSWNKKKTGPKQSKTPQNKDSRKYIDDRPELSGVGHYEVDFIVSRQSTWVLLVVVDILTKYTRVVKLPNRKRTTISRAFSELFCGIPVQSITTDNDIAFQHWLELEDIIQAPIYFCHPYHSWEKGSVENTNRWIRCFVPKNKDISLVTQSEMDCIHTYLNDRPRAVIDFRKSSEYYQSMCSVLIEG